MGKGQLRALCVCPGVSWLKQPSWQPGRAAIGDVSPTPRRIREECSPGAEGSQRGRAVNNPSPEGFPPPSHLVGVFQAEKLGTRSQNARFLLSMRLFSEGKHGLLESLV